jgi:glycosidase
VHPNYRFRNVESQQEEPDSILNFTQEVIELRQEKLALQRGDFTLLTTQPKDTLAYLRHTPEQTLLVALNFKDRPAVVENVPDGNWNTHISTNRDSGARVVVQAGVLQLAPYEVLILESK